MTAKTLKQRQRRKQRKVGYSQFDTILRLASHRCHWCKESIIRLKAIKRRYIVKTTPYEVTYKTTQGNAMIRRIATLDHVTPLGDNGSPNANNIVAACFECNQRRNIEHQRSAIRAAGKE